MQEMTSLEFKDAVEKGAIVIIPVGSTEQHGAHLPLGTDAMIGFEIAKKASEKIKDEVNVVIAPAVTIGLSIEHIDFPGTITTRDAATLTNFLKDICKSLTHHGVRKIILLNAHGGNRGLLMNVAVEVRKETGAFVVIAEWFRFAREEVEKITSTLDIHGGECETSLMLFLFPNLVQMDKARKEFPDELSVKEYITFGKKASKTEFSWLTADLSKSGIIGDPTQATADKGKKLFEIIVEKLCCLLKELKNLSD